MRIGFLFNHDQIHQVAHALPIALELAGSDPSVEIIIASTNDALHHEILRLIALLSGNAPKLVRLSPKRTLVRHAVRMLDGILPAAKLAVYRDNLDFFRSLDALVVTEKTSTILKTRYKLDGLRLIHTRHGAGDRSVGFDRASSLFDFVLVAGPKIRDRLAAEASVAPEKMAMVGYPKFDIPVSAAPPGKLRGRGRPIVLYNPHVSPHLSSWYKHGRAVLDHFLDHPTHDLIFAPHVMLFERKVALSIDKLGVGLPGSLSREYWEAPGIHIDLGSSASTDMSYTQAADIYLGDVSSQVYEFLIRPRPCIFLNSHRLAYRSDPNFAHWAAGPVISDPSQLGESVARAEIDHQRFADTQRKLFASSINLIETPSSQRAAEAIREYLGVRPSRLARGTRRARSAAA